MEVKQSYISKFNGTGFTQEPRTRLESPSLKVKKDNIVV